MAEKFVDRKSTYPNRYKITKADGSSEYITLERADEPTVVGTPLNAAEFNAIINELNGKLNKTGGTMTNTVTMDANTHTGAGYRIEKTINGVFYRFNLYINNFGVPSIAGSKDGTEFCRIVLGENDVKSTKPISLNSGGTGATSGATGLKNLFADGATILSSHQYGDTLPDPGTPGRIFFKKKVT